MGFGSAALTYFFYKNICFKLITISVLGGEDRRGGGPRPRKVWSLADHMDMSFG